MARTAIQVIFDSLADFPVVGSTTIIYVDNTTQKAYLWDGAAYVAISGSSGGGASVYDGTGVINGLTITANADTTKIDIAAGSGVVVDNTTTPGTPIVVPIVYAGATGITVTNIAIANTSYITINSSGVVVQRTTEPTPNQRRDEIFLGIVIHSNRVAVNAINNQPEVVISETNQFYDLITALKGFNETGNVIGYNGANLQINKSVGSIFKRGANFVNDPKDPHTITTPILTAPTTIRYRLQNGTEYVDTNAIDPAFYDLAGVKTAVNGNNWTVQRVYLFPSNLIRIQYGQAVYPSSAAAIQAIPDEVFVTESNIADNGLLRGLIIVKSGATVLNDTGSAIFRETNRFGDIQSVTSGGTTTMQQSYNNSVAPQITTTTALGAVQFKRGSAADTNAVLQVLNGADVANFSINGNGAITQSGATGTLQALTMSDSYAASGIGQSITIGNTQTNALTALKIDTGTSVLGHIGTLYSVFNASTSARAIKIDLSGGTGYGIEFVGSTSGNGTRGIYWDEVNKVGSSNLSRYGIYQNIVQFATNGNGYGIYQAKISANLGNGYGIYQDQISTGGGPAYGFYQGNINTTTSGNGYGIYQNQISFNAGGNGIGWYVAQLSSSTSETNGGKFFSLNTASSGSANILARTLDTSEILYSKTNTATTGTKADNFNILNIRRTTIQNGAGGTTTAAGSVLKLENVATQTAGTLTDTVDVLFLNQSTISTGMLVKGQKAGVSTFTIDKDGNFLTI